MKSFFKKKQTTTPQTDTKKSTDPFHIDEKSPVFKMMQDFPILKNLSGNMLEKAKVIAEKKGLTKTLQEALDIFNNKSLQDFITDPSNILTLATGSTYDRGALIAKFVAKNPMLSLRMTKIASKFKPILKLVQNLSNISGMPIPNFISGTSSDENQIIDDDDINKENNRDDRNNTNNGNNSIVPTDGNTTNANSEQKSIDIDKTINATLSTGIIIMVYTMICIVLAILINSIYNYASFCYYTIYETILLADETNFEKIYIRDTYSFKLLNYVFCANTNEEIAALKDCQSTGIGYYIEYFIKLIAPLDDCDSESKLNIYGGNKMFNFAMKLIYLIIVIALIQCLACFIIYIFLGGMRRYNVIGKDMFSYLYSTGSIYIYTILLIFLYCLVHSLHFKFMFIDNVYDRIFKKYEIYRTIDHYVNNEAKAIQEQKQFLELLTSSTINNIGTSSPSDTYNHKGKIVENIKGDVHDEIYASKLFLYTLYEYIVDHNDDKDIEIIHKLNSVVQQKEGNMFTMRSFFKLNLDMNTVRLDLNKIVSNIGNKIADAEAKKIFDGFDLATSESNINGKVSKLAKKLKKFYDLLENSTNVDFGDVIYYMNMYLVLEWVINIIFILILITVLYYNSDQSPLVKRIIVYITAMIMTALEELKMAFIGI